MLSYQEFKFAIWYLAGKPGKNPLPPTFSADEALDYLKRIYKDQDLTELFQLVLNEQYRYTADEWDTLEDAIRIQSIRINSASMYRPVFAVKPVFHIDPNIIY